MNSTVPGMPIVAEVEPIPETVMPSDVFILHYRKGNDVLFIPFSYKKPSPEVTAREQFRLAVERAKLHCEKMRYRFIFVRPYVTDLDEEEKRMPL